MLAIHDLSFAWADGTPVFDGVELAFGPGRTGLVGVNGSGKSTLLRVLAGELTPSRGSVRAGGVIGYLPQNLPLGVARTVSDLLGITAAREALHAIERGDVSEANYAAVVWDVEERARGELDRLGLRDVGLDRQVAALSGGETVLVGLAARFLLEPDVLLLDEPTNNLDLAARRRLYDAVLAWNRTLVVVSHDRTLLGLVDQIVELPSARVFGGNFDAQEEILAAERTAAERAVRTAEGDLKRQRRDLAEARVKLDRRARYGKKMSEQKNEPKIVMGNRKRQAEVSAGKHRTLHEEKVEQARERLTEAEQAVRDDAEIRVALPATTVPTGRIVLSLPLYGLTATDHDISEISVDSVTSGLELSHLIVKGPERIALVGPNGSGKTTLLERIANHTREVGSPDGVFVPMRYLPQRLDILDDDLSVLENVRAVAPETSMNNIRAGLARFLFRGARVGQPVGTLSGGERFRAVLAALLLAEPQLLLMDEPTNNLDLASVRQLAQALSAYRGALIVASHDLPFLESINPTRRIDTSGLDGKQLDR
ncbi:ATP-binding cassette domain-containing protein [Acrocarpospora macrocephala]|uniref:ABC transporter n=1 Tax=Acrocarpospora macrocephala TaxID=150177 RepID=A0A5M3WHK4_9ACTN|nr:ATP-binding cassette domain-containing protein [Acrocarpospora macrocephala]GES08615.1 ABC transporter [Acrocarpospora macrocephala]